MELRRCLVASLPSQKAWIYGIAGASMMHKVHFLCSGARRVAVNNSQHLVECPETCPVMTSEFVEKENMVLNIKQKGSGAF